MFRCLQALLVVAATATAYAEPPNLAIIPKPVRVESREGKFVLDASCRVMVPRGAPELLGIGRRLAARLAKNTGRAVPVEESSAGQAAAGVIRLSTVDAEKRLGDEGYELAVSPKSIAVRAPKAAGVFYAAQTLVQLLPAESGPAAGVPKECAIPCLHIEDFPRFVWRGMSLDVARHFFPKEFVKRYIDHLAAVKINVFHFYLTDDQGWRIEIKRYPRLTQIGAWRSGTVKHYWNGAADRTRYGGFFTQDEIREIVDYARQRHVTVVPGISMPGHSQAVLACYPELSSTGGPFEVWTRWGISKEVMDPGKEEVFQFVEGVLSEVSDLFPGPYIHCGGDEVPRDRWKASPYAQARIKKEGLKNEGELQAYFTKRVERFLKSKGKTLIGWDEILEGGLAPNAVVMSWRGTAGGITAARAKHHVVMTPHAETYFNYMQQPEKKGPGHPGYLPLSAVYRFDPTRGLTPDEAKFVLGGQGCLWTEYVPTPADVEFLLFPRLFAMAEVLWSPQAHRDEADFLRRVRARPASQTADTNDWTEAGGTWQTQSYWQDPRILQRYTFTENTADKVAGQSSVEVHMEVGPERKNNLVELRLILPKPLDLSKVDAIEVWLKQTAGERLTSRDVFLCDPGFGKLTIAAWPERFELVPGGSWQRAIMDLTEARVFDKANPNAYGKYDRHDVATICLNFLLPEGRAVDAHLQIDGLAATRLPPPAVEAEKRSDGSYVFTTARYRAVVGADGYLQSLCAGTTEFLKPHSAVSLGPKLAAKRSALSASACYPDNDPAKGPILLQSPELSGRSRLEAQGEHAAIKYVFREDEFDVHFKQDFTEAGLLWFALSPQVVAALDGRTDRALRAEGQEAGDQLDTRLMTRTGAVLACKQHFPGYSRMSLASLSGRVWAFRHLAYGPHWTKLTLRPVAEPSAQEAVGLRVECADPDFLLPGGEPVRFEITAKNYAQTRSSGDFRFQVCDYLTRKPVAERVTPFALEPGREMAVPTDVALTQPGPYRGRVVVDDGRSQARAIEWVFTYDFPGYCPALTRKSDFQQFWKDTLAELARIPLDAQVVAVPEQSTATAEAFRVSLATLGGRRVWCWYWKPRKPGRYPVQFEVPSSGVYPRKANTVPHGDNLCGMWMGIHGLPVDYDPKNPPQDPAAWNYWTHGISSPNTSMWRTIYASLVRGVDFLCSRPEVEAKRIMVAGGSQGGGLSMILAGLDRRVAFAAPAHSGLARLDWTVLHAPGFWPFGMGAKPAWQSTEQFLATLSYFDAANFTPDIACPIVAEVSLLDTVTASGNQICALSHVKPGLLQLICDPWTGHASEPRGAALRAEAVNRWLRGEGPVKHPVK